MTVWSATTLFTNCTPSPLALPTPADAPAGPVNIPPAPFPAVPSEAFAGIGIARSRKRIHRPMMGPIPIPNTANRRVR